MKLCMHIVPSDAYLYGPDFADLLINTNDVDQDITLAEIASYDGVYVVLCAYDFSAVGSADVGHGISGLEFVIDGWPTARGSPPVPSLDWTADDTGMNTLVQGNCFSGGCISAAGTLTGAGCNKASTIVKLRDCWQMTTPTDTRYNCFIYPFAYFYVGTAAVTDYGSPISLVFGESAFSHPASPYSYTLDCAISYDEDVIVDSFGCALGGTHGGDLVTSVEPATWTTVKALYRTSK
ncbi:MAG: hypothetical protein KAW17_11290 [Candidatus Eisenbacteria sp.]|nr:hypothetical protein [Candidatus Eisenbacteria bacterium]